MKFTLEEYIFCSVLAIQLVYWLCFFKSSKKQKKRNPEFHPVSIVVCAKNEFDHLKALIPQLLSQKYEEYEIIIINDRSNDSTPSLYKKHPQINWVIISDKPEEVNGKKHALERGIQTAQFDHILLTDADCRPASKDWITTMVSSLKIKKGIVLGISPYFKENNNLTNLVTQFDTSYTALQYISAAKIGIPYMGVGRNLLYHKSFFTASKIIRKHSNTTGGDDDLLINKVANETNTSYCLDPNSFCYTYPQDSLPKWFQQKRRHLGVSKYYSLISKLYLGLLNLSHLVIILLFLSNGIFSAYSWLILTGFLLRTSIIFSTFGLVSKTMGGQLSRGAYIIIDFIYPLYLFSLGGYATVFKTKKWK